MKWRKTKRKFAKSRRSSARARKADGDQDTRSGLLLVAACILSLIVPPIVKASQTPVTITFDRAPLPAIVIPTTPPTAPTPPVARSAPRTASVSSSKPSQAQKDATASVCRHVLDNRHDLIASSGVPSGVFLTSCYYDLLAMAYAESRFNCDAVGDQGRSHGCFQIQTAMHGVSVKDAEDYAYAAEWTLDRMVRDTNYPRMRTASITRHNGAGDGAAMYAESVKETSQQFKNSKF